MRASNVVNTLWTFTIAWQPLVNTFVQSHSCMVAFSEYVLHQSAWQQQLSCLSSCTSVQQQCTVSAWFMCLSLRCLFVCSSIPQHFVYSWSTVLLSAVKVLPVFSSGHSGASWCWIGCYFDIKYVTHFAWVFYLECQMPFFISMW